MNITHFMKRCVEEEPINMKVEWNKLAVSFFIVKIQSGRADVIG